MRFYQRGVLLLFSSLILLGCASSGPIQSYDASKNTTVYESGNIAVGEASDGGYGSESTAITMRATSECSGVNCTPESARLQFSMEGSTDGGFTNQTLSITADGVDYTFGNRVRQTGAERTELSQIQNLEVMGIPFSDLEKIASAKSLSGTLGGLNLDLKSAQSDLQEFVAMVQNPEGVADGS